jgi:N6-L-threonylcarbamoyladenine synthase
LVVEGVGRYRRLGTTIDDALGEAFDKVAKMLGLGYPGGPAVEQTAARGRAGRFFLPRPMKGRAGCDFSFSGLKTAVGHAVAGFGTLGAHDVADLAFAFQEAVGDVVEDRTANAIEAFRALHPKGDTLVIAGGVAANRILRARMQALADSHGLGLVAPPPRLCTDNAAMIAWAGIERLKAGFVDALDFAPRPRWPLDPKAPPALGAGVKA